MTSHSRLPCSSRVAASPGTTSRRRTRVVNSESRARSTAGESGRHADRPRRAQPAARLLHGRGRGQLPGDHVIWPWPPYSGFRSTRGAPPLRGGRGDQRSPTARRRRDRRRCSTGSASPHRRRRSSAAAAATSGAAPVEHVRTGDDVVDRRAGAAGRDAAPARRSGRSRVAYELALIPRPDVVRCRLRRMYRRIVAARRNCPRNVRRPCATASRSGDS